MQDSDVRRTTFGAAPVCGAEAEAADVEADGNLTVREPILPPKYWASRSSAQSPEASVAVVHHDDLLLRSQWRRFRQQPVNPRHRGLASASALRRHVIQVLRWKVARDRLDVAAARGGGGCFLLRSSSSSRFRRSAVHHSGLAQTSGGRTL